MTLTEFLLARIDEDEKVAQSATEGPWEAHTGAYRMASLVRGDVWIGDIDHDPDVAHIARHDPARVLAECEAKRQLIERVGNPDWAGFRILATPYTDHPDYRQEWKP